MQIEPPNNIYEDRQVNNNQTSPTKVQKSIVSASKLQNVNSFGEGDDKTLRQNEACLEKKDQTKNMTKKIYKRKKPKPVPILPLSAHKKTKQSIKKVQKQITQRKLQKMSNQQSYLDQITISLKKMVDQYNQQISFLDRKAQKLLYFKEELLFNPIPFTKIKFIINFAIQFSKQVIGTQQREWFYWDKLKAYPLDCWFRIMFQQFRFLRMCPQKQYDPNKHRNLIKRTCFIIFKHLLLFTNLQNRIEIFNALKEIKNPSQDQVFSILNSRILDVTVDQILRKVNLCGFTQSKKTFFYHYVGTLYDIFAYAPTKGYLLNQSQNRPLSMEKVFQLIGDTITSSHGDHNSQSVCPKCGMMNSIQLGFPSEDSQQYGYYCQQNCQYFQKVTLHTKQPQIVSYKTKFYPENIEFGQYKFKSIVPLIQKNNLGLKVRQKFGENAFKSQYQSLCGVPKAISTVVTLFSEQTQSEIMHNRKKQQNLPLTISQSSVLQAGYGMFATADLEPNRIVVSYIGQYVLTDTIIPCDSLYNIGWITIDNDQRQLSIRPKISLNSGRFINTHTTSKMINCKPICGIVDGQISVIIITLRKIYKGQELFYQYGRHYDLNEFKKTTQRINKIIEKQEGQAYYKKVSTYNGKLLKQQLAKLYRQYTRQKYNKIKHQFPRLRQSQIVSRIIKMWQALTSLQKDNLYDQYQNQKFFKKQNDSSDEETQKKNQKQSVIKLQSDKKQVSEVRKTGVKTYIRYDKQYIRQKLIVIIRDCSFVFDRERKNKQMTNADKIAEFQRRFDNVFTGQLLLKWIQFINDLKLRFACDPAKTLLGIYDDQKSYTRKHVEFEQGIHKNITPAYEALLNPHHYLQKINNSIDQIRDNEDRNLNQNMVLESKAIEEDIVPMVIEKQQIIVPQKQQIIAPQFNKQMQLREMFKQPNVAHMKIMKKSFYLALKKIVNESIGQFNPKQQIQNYKRHFQIQKQDRTPYQENIEIFCNGNVFIQESKKSSNTFLRKKQCRICMKTVLQQRWVTHLRHDHQQQYWAQWILVNFLNKSWVFTGIDDMKCNYGLLRFKIQLATKELKTKKTKLNQNIRSGKDFICWQVKNGVFTIVDTRISSQIIHNTQMVQQKTQNNIQSRIKNQKLQQHKHVNLLVQSCEMKDQKDLEIQVEDEKDSQQIKRSIAARKGQETKRKNRQKFTNQLVAWGNQTKQKEINKLKKQKEDAKAKQKEANTKGKQMQQKISFCLSGVPKFLHQKYQRRQCLNTSIIQKSLKENGVDYKHVFGERSNIKRYCENWDGKIIFYQVPSHFGLILKTHNKFITFDGKEDLWPKIDVIKSTCWQSQGDNFSCGYRVIFWALKIKEIGVEKWIKQIEHLRYSQRRLKRKKIVQNIPDQKCELIESESGHQQSLNAIDLDSKQQIFEQQ